MSVRTAVASAARRLADTLGPPSFSGTPFPTGGVDTPKQLTEELGSTGTWNFGGWIRGEDPNQAMDGMTAIRNLDEMRRADGQVHASLEVVKQPIRTANYEVDASDEDDPESVAIAEFVKWNLFERMTTTWDDLIRQSLLMLDFGFMLFEKVWSIQEDGDHQGRIVIHKLGPRPPKTIQQWFTDEDGALLSIKQLAVKAGAYQYLDVPASKLVRFTFQQEGDNFQGISMLRTAYPHWSMKKQFYLIDAIRASRFGVGVPRVKFAAGFSPSRDDNAALSTMLQGLSSHQHAYLIEPPQFTTDILIPSGTQGGVDIMPSIEHHNSQITRNILAQFLDMGGASSGGSHALGASAMDFFLNAIESIADQICDTLNKQLIQDLVDMNFDSQKYPTLRPVGIQETDVKSLAMAAAALAKAGLLTADMQTENTFRNLMNLPERAEDEPQPGAPAAPGVSPPNGAVSATPATSQSTPATPATSAPTPATPATTQAATATPATSAQQPAILPDGATVPQQAAAQAAAAGNQSMRPAVDAEETQPGGTTHDPRGMTTPARSTYYGDAEAVSEDGAGPLEAQTSSVQPQPAVAHVRDTVPATTSESRTIPAHTDAMPSEPERAHMARSSTASSGDADEEGAPSSEASLSRSFRQRDRASFLLPDGVTRLGRVPTALEERVLDLREMPRRLDTARSALRGTLLGVREEQISRIASAVAHAQPGDQIRAPLVGKMAADIVTAMQAIYEYGQGQVQAELRRQRRDGGFGMAEVSMAAPKTKAKALPHLIASAKVSAQNAADKLLGSAQQEALRLKRAGWEDDEVEDALLISMGELSDADITRLAAMEINEAFSLGRVAAGEEFKGQIESATYSCLMDVNSCDPCEENDGKEVDVDSDEYDELMPPYSNCEGGDSCRCAWIYVLKDDSGAEAE